MPVDQPPLPPEIERLAAEAAKDDSFGPPPEPCLCMCLHCHREFMSDVIWFQITIKNGQFVDGFWMCPTANCGGAGFQMDIFPVDPGHPANAGWHSFDDDESDEFDDETSPPAEGETVTADPEPYDPEEPKFALMDEGEGTDNDIEGEEWKHGIPPGGAWNQQGGDHWAVDFYPIDCYNDWTTYNRPITRVTAQRTTNGQRWNFLFIDGHVSALMIDDTNRRRC